MTPYRLQALHPIHFRGAMPSRQSLMPGEPQLPLHPPAWHNPSAPASAGAAEEPESYYQKCSSFPTSTGASKFRYTRSMPEDNAGLQGHLQMLPVSLHPIYLVATPCQLVVAALTVPHIAWVAYWQYSIPLA